MDKLTPPPGFVLVKPDKDSWVKSGNLYIPTQKAYQSYFTGTVVGVGVSTYSRNGKKFFDTSEVKVGDQVICSYDEVSIYEDFEFGELAKVPIYSILAIIENQNGGLQ